MTTALEKIEVESCTAKSAINITPFQKVSIADSRFISNSLGDSTIYLSARNALTYAKKNLVQLDLVITGCKFVGDSVGTTTEAALIYIATDKSMVTQIKFESVTMENVSTQSEYGVM
jgi:hypothetical protein